MVQRIEERGGLVIQVGKEPDKMYVLKPATMWLNRESQETLTSETPQLRARDL